MRQIFLAILVLLAQNILAQEYQTNISVHDPVIIKQDSVFYIFCTGRGISVWSSKDMQSCYFLKRTLLPLLIAQLVLIAVYKTERNTSCTLT